MKPKPPPGIFYPESGSPHDEDPTSAYRGVLIGLAISAVGLVVAFVVLVLVLAFT